MTSRRRLARGQARARLVAHAEHEHVDEGSAGVAAAGALEHRRRAAGHVPVVRQRLCYGGLPHLSHSCWAGNQPCFHFAVGEG